MNYLNVHPQTSLNISRRTLLRTASLTGVALLAGVRVDALGRSRVHTAMFSEALTSTPLADQLDWFLAAVNSGGTALTETDVSDHFAPDLLSVLPAAEIVRVIQSLALGFGAFTLQGTTRLRTLDQAVALVSAAVGVQIAIPIAIEANSPHRITGLTIFPSPAGDGLPLQPVTDSLRESTTATLVEIGGRGIYFSDVGSGGPTVIFEAGLGDSAATWSGIIPAIAAVTRVVSYDRANTTAGASDPTQTPRSANDAVDDLRALLLAAQIPGPYVFVGHSIGGLVTRLYASRYPDDVAGMVLIDSSHEEQDVRRQDIVSAELFAAEQAMVGANSEGIDLAVSFTQMREIRATSPMKELPLFVLSAGKTDPANYPVDWPLEAEAELHSELQLDLASLVPGGQQIVAEQSGHYIQQSQPDLVVKAILDVVQAVIDPDSWTAR